MRTVNVTVYATLTMLALAGCASSTGNLDATDSPVAHYDWDEGAAMQALLEGTLELRDGCLYVVGQFAEDDPYSTIPVFPRSLASWDSDTQTLTYGGEEFRIGDQVAAGGGGVESVEGATIPEGCEVNGTSWAFYIQDTDLSPMSERDF